jgi:hypothetical protein
MANHPTSHARATKVQPKNVELKLTLHGAKRRSYFNTFDLDFDAEKHFIISRFAFVRWGECIDCASVLLPKAVVQNGREIFMTYVKEVGLSAIDYEFKIQEIPRFNHGIVEIADVVNVSRSGDIAEINLYGFSFQHAAEGVKKGEASITPEFLVTLRSSLSLQIQWITKLYAKS